MTRAGIAQHAPVVVADRGLIADRERGNDAAMARSSPSASPMRMRSVSRIRSIDASHPDARSSSKIARSGATT
jgi:hypothetical protein